jgi:hypothetical protein
VFCVVPALVRSHAADLSWSPFWLTLYEEQYTFSKGYSQRIIILACIYVSGFYTKL